ncbi:MAG: photosystem II protein Psb27 [Cyanobacteriota bacterium]|nr:photosystem II protein Psb27 [Cyanobacteriota bacterium]
MKRFLSSVLALVLVVAIGLGGCSSSSSGITGNYRQDSLTMINTLRTAIELPEGTPEKAKAQAQAKDTIYEFIARYRRDENVTGRPSFTTIQTALDSLAGHYNSYGNRPLSKKLKTRLDREFQQVEAALNRES